jgi:ketosteroid isomerase-like protein
MRPNRSFPVRFVALPLMLFAATTVESGPAGKMANSHAMEPAASQEKPRASSVAEELAKLREQWVRELHDKQLDPIIALYAPDAAFLSPSGGRFTGQGAIRGLFKTIMDTVTSNLTLHSMVTESSGDLAYDSGDYTETLVPTKGGPDQHYQGDYLMVFKRQKDGKWLIVQHVWTFAGNELLPPSK